MKLRCVKINANWEPMIKDYFQVDQVYEAKRRPSRHLNVADVIDGYNGLSWYAVQKGSKFNLNLASGPAVTFVLVKGPRRLVVTEKRVTGVLNDKRKFRRMCRQYGKLRFTEPGMFCFIAFAAMKKNARNHQR
ncbi:hypothetical protein [Escherichia coli]|uniref:hypothetical protein n=1 Tax=Escherichia coli TaxID=562 RepID=UPI00335594A4